MQLMNYSDYKSDLQIVKMSERWSVHYVWYNGDLMCGYSNASTCICVLKM